MRHYITRLYTLAVIALVFLLICCVEKQNYDVVILNGSIVDGSGGPPYQADLGIRGDSIAFIGSLEKSQGAKVIDALGMVVSPGFIDIHTHCDFGLDKDETRGNLPYLMQGATSVVTGNCGYRNHSILATKDLYDSIGGIGTNALPLIGFGDIRETVLGREDRQPSPQELEKMKAELRHNLQLGAWGMSSGLQYVPQNYSTIEEVVEVSTVLNEFGSLYTTHMRSEEEQIIDALREAIRICREADVPLNISHLKANGRMNWHYMNEVLEIIEEAQLEGINITADMYPYDKSATTALYEVFHIPKELKALKELEDMISSGLEGDVKNTARENFVNALQLALKDPIMRAQIRSLTENGVEGVTNWVAKGGWNYFSIVSAPKNQDLQNKMFVELSEETGKDPFEIAADLVVQEGGDIIISLSTMIDSNLVEQMQRKWVMFSSDGYAVNPEDTGVHPRSYGSNARVIRKYVNEVGALSIESAVYKMTGLPSKTLGLTDRGLIKERFKADIVIFDPNNTRDNASYIDPHQFASGIPYVILNGKISVDNGKFTNTYNGRFLLKIKSQTLK